MDTFQNNEQELQVDLKRHRITVNERTLLLLATGIDLVNEVLKDPVLDDKLSFSVTSLLRLASMSKEFLYSTGINDEIIESLIYFRDIHYNNQPRIGRAVESEAVVNFKIAQG